MRIKSKIEVITRDDMQRVHDASLRLLKEKGVVFLGEVTREIFKKNNFKMDGNIVYFDEEQVQKALKSCPQEFKLTAKNDERSVIVGGEGFVIHPPGGEVQIIDSEKGRREASMDDFARLQMLYQACDNIDIAGYQPVTTSDVGNKSRGLHFLHQSFMHSDKPILAPMDLEDTKQKRECLELYEVAFGKKGYLEDHYVTWHCVCPNSPLMFTDFACDGIVEFAKWNQPVLLVSAPMSGITGPVKLFGTLVLHNAETLAGLVLGQLVRPGVPTLPSSSLVYGNLQYASWECAAPETSLMTAASIQMNREFYNLPARCQSGITSSKSVNYQAGIETMQGLLFTALTGAQVYSQAVGSMENLIVTSFEKTIIDDEAVGRVRALQAGIDTSDEALSVDSIMGVDHGMDFLTLKETVKHMRDYFTPTVSDWQTYYNWHMDGDTEIVATAGKKAKEIWANAPETLLDPQTDKDMRDYIKMIEDR